ncbi:hypothetical protein L6164_029768 [Bauhinia variegata]|uniref:Uncharacterized protein n=1 Tax=Bauhinia variegata TaxID=167791 RepID=A0ACB9LBM7_BAUVA|nr:hypothetical protein L6164_029768 [Bauhinia variegata]
MSQSSSETEAQTSAPDPQKFDPTQPSVPISYPIKSLHEVESRSYFESFHYPFNKASVSIDQNGYPTSLPNRRRLLVCHDMMGGYVDDKWVQGGTNPDAYAIWHWHLIDVFVYFSHNLVTLPPPCWTNAAHRHGVKVLGTFITEWEEGKVISEALLATKESGQMYAERLAELAVALGFDGWLLNMEVTLDQGRISNLKEFVNHLTLTMHSSVPGSLVIWYDSITTNGALIWQNQLNQYNKPFFDLCDGIFVNYTWRENYPRLSAAVAGDRKFDVYMGIDVFGRNTYGGGQWNANVALDRLRKDDVSAAVFAPGWVYESKQPPNFETAQNRWWGLVEKSWGALPNNPKALPFYTNFDQGRGYRISVDGYEVSDNSWCNLSNQGFQPFLEYAVPSPDSIQVFVDFKEASYSGGGNLVFKGSLEGKSHFLKRIFQGEFLLGEFPLHFMYSVKSDGNSLLGLSFDFSSTTNERKSILLSSEGMSHLSSKFSNVRVTRELKGPAPGWVIQEGSIAMKGYTLTAIYAVCYRPNSYLFSNLSLESGSSGRDSTESASTDYYAVLGHVTIKTSDYKPNFPVSNSWLVDGEHIKWTSDPKGSKALSVKINWKLKDGSNSGYSNYKVYVQKLSKETVGNQGALLGNKVDYLGTAQVSFFYVSDLHIPSGTSGLKFIIQVSSADGTNQALDDSPYYQLEIKEP